MNEKENKQDIAIDIPTPLNDSQNDATHTNVQIESFVSPTIGETMILVKKEGIPPQKQLSFVRQCFGATFFCSINFVSFVVVGSPLS